MNLDFKNIVFGDTETTGIEKEDRIIENAFLLFDGHGKPSFEEVLCKAEVPVKPAAAMTHGYREWELQDKPFFKDTDNWKRMKNFQKNKNYVYVAHNAPFDIEMLKKDGISFPPNRVIDTLQVAKHLYKDDERVEMFKLQYFRELFEFDRQDFFKDAMKQLGLEEIKPHTALSDVFILWLFTAKLREDFNVSVEEMIRLSLTPVEEPYIKFGNIFAEEDQIPYSEVVKATYEQYGKVKHGHEYLHWAVNNMDYMPLEREFAIKKAMGYAIINKEIPFRSGYEKYLFFCIGTVFTEDESLTAKKVLSSETPIKTIQQSLVDLMTKKIQEFEIPEGTFHKKAKKMENDIKKMEFLRNYIQYVRLQG